MNFTRWPLRILFVGILVLLAGAHPARAQSGLMVYVPNQSTNNVRVFRTETGGGLTPVATIAVGVQPKEAILRADQAFAYVANNVGTISVISTKTNTVVQTIAAGAFPWGMAFNPDNTRLYAANRNGDTISVYSVAESTGLLTAAGVFGSVGGPLALAVTPDGTRLYSANTTANVVRIYDTSNGGLVTNIPVGSAPLDLVMNSTGSRVYIPNFGGNTVSVIDTSSNTVLGTFPTGAGPTAVAVSANGSVLLCPELDRRDHLTTRRRDVYSYRAGDLDGRYQRLRPRPHADGSVLYATNDQNDSIALFSVGTSGAFTSLGTQAVGLGNSSPFGFGICDSNGNNLLRPGNTFVANSAGALGCMLDNPVFTGGTFLINNPGLVFTQPFTFSGGGAINTNGHTAEFSGTFAGAGGLSKEGPGTLMLSGHTSSLGALTVLEGTLRVTGSLAVASTVVVHDGAILEGSGLIGTHGDAEQRGEAQPGKSRQLGGHPNDRQPDVVIRQRGRDLAERPCCPARDTTSSPPRAA